MIFDGQWLFIYGRDVDEMKNKKGILREMVIKRSRDSRRHFEGFGVWAVCRDFNVSFSYLFHQVSFVILKAFPQFQRKAIKLSRMCSFSFSKRTERTPELNKHCLSLLSASASPQIPQAPQ